MYEFVNGSGRLIYALYRRTGDLYVMKQIAELLGCSPWVLIHNIECAVKYHKYYQQRISDDELMEL